MKNIIIKYGLISGGIAAVSIMVTTFVMKAYGFNKACFEYSAYFGYTFIILSMSAIFFGIKAYRDKENGGKISFGKGLAIGLSIAFISAVCYSLMWLVMYYNFMPNFIEDYAAFSLEKLKASGASEADLMKNQVQMQQFKEMYKTPMGVFGITLMEPLPIGVLVALVTALILKRK